MIQISGPKGSHKSTLLTVLVHWLYNDGCYPSEKIISNRSFPLIPGSIHLSNDEMVQWVGSMVAKELRGYLIAIDEIDRVLPSWDFGSKQQRKIITNLWHERILQQTIIFVDHPGKVTDPIIRDNVRWCLIPRQYDELNDTLLVRVIDAEKPPGGFLTVNNMSKIYPAFNSWEVIK